MSIRRELKILTLIFVLLSLVLISLENNILSQTPFVSVLPSPSPLSNQSKSVQFVLRHEPVEDKEIQAANVSESTSEDLFPKMDPFLTVSTAKDLLKTNKSFNLEDKFEIDGETLLQSAQSTADPTKNSFVKSAKLKSCIVVGAGSCLRGRNLGAVIDAYPVVIRMNAAPIRGYEALVGSKTDIRLLYPESAPRSSTSYQGAGIVAVVAYKQDDFIWAAQLANQKQNSSKPVKFEKTLRFWRKSPSKLPVHSDRIFIVNPQTGQFLFRKCRDDRSRRNGARATIGMVAIHLAFNLCRNVSVVGFCYGKDTGGGYNYYYGEDRNTGLKGTHANSGEPAYRAKIFSSELIHVIN